MMQPYPNHYQEENDFSPFLPHATTLQELWQVDQLAAEIGQESQARVAFIGRNHVGKRTLFNRLRGWVLQWPSERPTHSGQIYLEPFGSFLLADLPAGGPDGWESADRLRIDLGDPALIVYLLDATAGVTQADHRWIAAVRASGCPLIVALNKYDSAQRRVDGTTVQTQLGMPVIPVSGWSGLNLEDKLLPAMLQAVPKLAITLGREISSLRRVAARRAIWHATLFTAMIGTQPIPGLELPVLAATHVGLTMRIRATYGLSTDNSLNRDAVATIGAVMLLQYAIQTVVKSVPLVGSLVGGVLSAVGTLLIGELAITYYEAGATVKLPNVREKLAARWGDVRLWYKTQRNRRLAQPRRQFLRRKQ